MEKVYDVAYRKEILGESVPSKEKLFSIFEQHTDIIVKGSREVTFGHKIQLATGKSNLILDCKVLKGNPSDSTLFNPSLERIIDKYNVIPRDVSSDGGYASNNNRIQAEEKGIKNIVFNKVTQSLKNVASSKKMETELKKWRSGIEGIIGTLKNKLQLKRINWKGQAHFAAKVMWTAIVHNIRVMTGKVIQA